MSKLITFLKNWNELWILPLSFALLLLSDPFLKLFDQTAGYYDIGILQAVIVATFCVVWGWSLAWIVYKLSFPILAKWLDDVLETRLDNNFNEQVKYKAMLSLSVYWLYVLSFTIVLIHVI